MFVQWSNPISPRAPRKKQGGASFTRLAIGATVEGRHKFRNSYYLQSQSGNRLLNRSSGRVTAFNLFRASAHFYKDHDHRTLHQVVVFVVGDSLQCTTSDCFLAASVMFKNQLFSCSLGFRSSGSTPKLVDEDPEVSSSCDKESSSLTDYQYLGVDRSILQMTPEVQRQISLTRHVREFNMLSQSVNLIFALITSEIIVQVLTLRPLCFVKQLQRFSKCSSQMARNLSRSMQSWKYFPNLNYFFRGVKNQ